MARVTVEDCLAVVPNPFQLVLLAAQRARALSQGATITVKREDDKNTVIALREIAERTVSPSDLEADLAMSLSKRNTIVSAEGVDMVPSTTIDLGPDDDDVVEVEDIHIEVEAALAGKTGKKAA